MKELVEIQSELNAPKARFNDFGKYNYRSAEDIMKAVKPLLKQRGCILLLSDEVKEVGSVYTYNTQESDSRSGKSFTSAYNGTRVYVEATATIINSAGEAISVKASAREEVAKKGMDSSQITGTASSYARKYALNGLFAIDDGVDADSLNTSPQYTQQPQQKQQTKTQPKTQQPAVSVPSVDRQEIFELSARQEIEDATTREDLKRVYTKYDMLQSYQPFKTALTSRRKALGIKNSNEE